MQAYNTDKRRGKRRTAKSKTPIFRKSRWAYEYKGGNIMNIIVTAVLACMVAYVYAFEFIDIK